MSESGRRYVCNDKSGQAVDEGNVVNVESNDQPASRLGVVIGWRRGIVLVDVPGEGTVEALPQQMELVDQGDPSLLVQDG